MRRHTLSFDGHQRLILNIILSIVWSQATGYTQETRQQPPQRFEVQVNFVEVDALVVDGDDNFVTDLKQEDFEILEDGVAQEIATFRLIDIPVAPVPVTAEETAFVAPDVLTNEAPAESRIYVLVLDDFNTAPERSVVVRQVAREFIEKWMGEGDWVAVTNTSGSASHDFTNNRLALLEVIDKFMGRKIRSMALERLDVLETMQQRMNSNVDAEAIFNEAAFTLDAVQQKHAYWAQAALSHLRSVSRMLSGIEGRRKAIVFLGEGIAYDIYDSMSTTSGNTVVT